jgi:hypothetical protein
MEVVWYKPESARFMKGSLNKRRRYSRFNAIYEIRTSSEKSRNTAPGP